MSRALGVACIGVAAVIGVGTAKAVDPYLETSSAQSLVDADTAYIAQDKNCLSDITLYGQTITVRDGRIPDVSAVIADCGLTTDQTPLGGTAHVDRYTLPSAAALEHDIASHQTALIADKRFDRKLKRNDHAIYELFLACIFGGGVAIRQTLTKTGIYRKS